VINCFIEKFKYISVYLKVVELDEQIQYRPYVAYNLQFEGFQNKI